MKVRPVAEKQPGRRNSAARSAQRRDGNSRVEPPHQLLEYKDSAGDWRVKCRGQPSTCAGGQKRLDVFPISMKGCRQQMTYPGAHLDSRSFPAERESDTHRQDTAYELHRNKNRARYRLLITQDCL